MKWKYFFALLGSCGLVLIALGLYVYLTRPDGIYLAEGGLGYVVIRANIRGGEIVEPEWSFDFERFPKYYDTRLRSWRGGIIIESSPPKNAASEMGGDTLEPKIMKLSRSNRIRGDFDLTGYRETVVKDSRNKTPLPVPPIARVSCPSFLHRLNDVRVLQYFRTQRGGNDPVRSFDFAEDLLAAYPNDLYVRALYLEAALKKPDFDVFKKKLEEWRADFLASPDPYQERLPRLADSIVRSKALTDAGRNAWPVVEYALLKNAPRNLMVLPVYNDLATWFGQQKAILDCQSCAYPPAELNPARIGNYDMFGHTVLAKVTDIVALFMMIRGEREEALQFLLSGFYYGKWQSENGMPLHRLWGIQTKSIHLRTLSIYALNACETEEELKSVADSLERMKEGPRSLPKQELADYMEPYSQADYGQADIRFKASVAQYENLRGAVAARRQFLSKGDFPSNDSEFSAWLADGLPRDPFGDSPLKFYKDPDAFTIYSVGPDGVDNHAGTAYDPTNGDASAGDIFTRVPREREFPFPREGTRARTPEDLHRQYPRGLPLDIFAKTRTRPLGISAGPPVRIYSFGPDNDESRTVTDLGDNYKVEVTYDPSNGIMSNGDLSIDLPTEN